MVKNEQISTKNTINNAHHSSFCLLFSKKTLICMTHISGNNYFIPIVVTSDFITLSDLLIKGASVIDK